MASVNTTKGIDLLDGNGKTTGGNDNILAVNGTANKGDVWDGGAGTDTLFLKSNFVNINLAPAAISNVEKIVGGKHNDQLTLSAAQFGGFGSIDLGKGRDTLNVSVSKSADISGLTLASVLGTETVKLVGLASDDTLTLNGNQIGRFMALDLGLGHDTLDLTSNVSALNGLADDVLGNVEAVSAAHAAAAALIDLSLQTEGFTITGSALADQITGAQGNDMIAGGAGADKLTGGAGSDTLDYHLSAKGVSVNMGAGTAAGGDAEGDSFQGFENLVGSKGADKLTGDAGSNGLSAGGGRDILDGGAGADHLDGGAGQDQVNYTLSAAGVTVDLKLGAGLGGDAEGDTLTGIELVLGTRFDDALTGDDVANNLTGGDGNDTLTGNGGIDRLSGGNGNDSLSGGDGNDDLNSAAGNDTLDGGNGDDKLASGIGTDSLTGGAGADMFIFTSASGIGKGALGDVITDFVSGEDHIDLSKIDASTALTGNQAFTFIDAAAFGKHAGELRYDLATGLLSGDFNGDGKADFSLHLGAGTALLGTDIIL